MNLKEIYEKYPEANNQTVNKFIDEIESRKENHLIISIDGNCGSGKTYYSKIISLIYDCNVIHMDSFFLPENLKTEKRLEEVAGNIHYERFEEEVLKNLKKEEYKYKVYDCKLKDFIDEVCVNKKRLTIIEGTYSHSHNFKEYYDLSVCFSVDEETQIERIRQREGDKKLKVFLEKWIPLEEQYFRDNDIFRKCDLLIETQEDLNGIQ